MSSVALLVVLGGCIIDFKDRNDDTGAQGNNDDTGGGGGNLGDTWRARGKGNVFLLDGTEDHSLVVVEVSGTIPPREGEAYHGWLMGDDLESIYLGELAVNDDVVISETEIGLNAFQIGRASCRERV